MSDDIILKAKNISKQYRLGVVGTGTLGHDLNRFWAKIRGKEDPYLQIGAVNDRSASASSEYVWALKDINFEVKRGEILGIIGKNGAGKSTLLKILSRVTSPTTGSIKTRGRIASLLEVGTGMHPELTGRENVFLNGAILGMTKTEIASKIDEIVEFSGCQMYIDTPVKRYSSGMRVRLGFAVAAFLEPDILVVDEVLAVGDAEFQKKAIGKMQDISNTSGRTVLFVSHNMAAVKSLCDRVIVIKDGNTVFDGSTFEGINLYLSSGNKEMLDLSLREDRKGSQAIKLIDINMFDELGRKLQFADSLQPVSFEFKFRRDQMIPLDKLIVSVQIVSNDQSVILAFPSDEFYCDFETHGMDRLVLSLNSLGLRPGDYNLNFLSFNNDTNEKNYVDCIFNVFPFKVLGIKPHVNGRVLRFGPSAVISAKYSQ